MMSLLKQCFSEEKVNTSRQLEFDVAKGIALICMVWVHTLEETGSVTHELMPTLIEKVFGGPFAAPVFIMTLGIGLAYSKNHVSPKQLVQRGIQMLIIGFVLNLVRFVAPAVWKSVGLNQPFDYENEIMWLVSVDILQFAGLAFLYFAVVKKYQLNAMALIIIAVACSLLGTVLHGITIDSVIGKQFLGYFWAASEETFFPFLNWIIFPTAGYLFGLQWQKCCNKTKFYQYVAPVSLFLGLGYIALTLNLEWGMYGNEPNAHYYLNLLDTSFVLLFVVGWFGACHALLTWLPEKCFKPLLNLSKNIIQVYCIHWIILGFLGVWFRHFLEKTQLPTWEVTLYALVVLMCTGIFAEIYVRFIKNRLFKS